MYKKITIITILALVIFNFTAIEMYGKNKNSKINGIQKIYILQGKNENWSVEDYKIIISFHEFKTGWGKVHIIGNNINIKDLTYYKLDIVKVDRTNNERRDILISKSITTNVPGLSFESNLNSGETSNENNIDKAELNNYNLEQKYDVYANIEYRIKGGDLKQEEFKLNVAAAISENNNKIKVVEDKN